MAAKLRCAIYTRKSSEEGLEQDFNSLHAQRESCEAYVLSQAGEGWTALKETYDDGGFSGGSMERPGLKRLLEDIEAGKIDIVVVYKVDRITRSLNDFARIVDVFDRRGVSFVSVTQAFNTTTSMGRLTLNVLLSFAQFEREVTGERIRDKIAASKAKGMWMGGNPPLGYDAKDRKLVINEAEARVVRSIFERYLELGSARTLALELETNGTRSKAWVSNAGRAMGGTVMSRGAVIHILQSRVYVGEIVHKGGYHPGMHEPIINRDLFEAVATKLKGLALTRRERPVKATPGPLAGRLYDASNEPMGPSFAYGRGGRLYRYYIASALQTGLAEQGPAEGLRRVSAPAVETFLIDQLCRLTGRRSLQPADLATMIHRVQLRDEETHVVLDGDAAFPDEHPGLALSAIRRRLADGEQAVADPGKFRIRVVLPCRLKLRGGRAVLIGANEARPRKINPGMVQALKRAHRDLADLNASPFTDPEDLVNATAPVTQHDRQVAKLALMSPTLQRQILSGQQPVDLNLRQILKTPMPLAWADQPAWLEGLAAA